MFNHFHRQHNVERLARGRKALGCHRAIVDRQARLLRMALRDGDIARRRVNAGDCGAEPRQRLRQNAAAAADVENAQAIEGPCRVKRGRLEMCGDLLAQIAEPHRVDLVQRLHRAFEIPPLRAKPLKARQIGRVYC